MTTFYSEFDSPFGPTRACLTGGRLSRVWIEGQKHAPALGKDWQRDDRQPLFQQLREQLQQYHDGQRQAFSLPLAPAGTAFQQQVWQALLAIPYGDHCSYGMLANRIGRPSSVRAVAAAVGRNPLLWLIPCHRVLGADGSLTGFAAGLQMKRQLLALERKPDLQGQLLLAN
ncbi:methylated-DNA--[protein]-cysteine S-methyltransferase [Marinobacterium arenosum]|uniref:methylated-DNA--[protein]-cysteine S-methyltransferase n=1 Tax=Marinobacterium arenosum TaxID=2862496 RepID=UPI001C95BAA2|nr:methylated-DNA--[protein]-cysteine S-methyltransferase [Marinobacterium arenosum]MBY4677322.1 methylated-DNA--[protein]-cysteine S-methyltransferase [Marinobacterium arenosum]